MTLQSSAGYRDGTGFATPTRRTDLLFKGAPPVQKCQYRIISLGVTYLSSIIVLSNMPACAQPQLIANSQLNQSRIHDTVDRASYASGLPVNHPLAVTLVNRAELHEIFRERAAANHQSDPWRARQTAYQTMGFSPEGGQDSHENIGLLSRSAAGLYIPSQQTLYIVSEPARSEKGGIYLNSLGNLGDELTLAHEVVHALQHQHFPEAFKDAPVWQQQADANTALQAAIEGDANLRAAQSMGLLGTARDPEEVIEFSRDRKFQPLSDESALVHERVVFPYIYGYRFAYHEGKNGLKTLPASTEQIIHIKTKGRTPFLAIDLSEFSGMAETIGCRVMFQDTMGELLVSLWLRSLNSSVDQAAWNGWDGDRWVVADCGQSREVAWLTSWDTEEDAREFERAVTKVAPEWQWRANLKSDIALDLRGRDVIVSTSGLRPQIDQLIQLAKRKRVSTREELAAHFTAPVLHSPQR